MQDMKKIFIILVLVLLTAGCNKTAVKEQPAKEPKPVVLGINVIEKSVHNFIVGARPEGKYLAFDVEIKNIGEEAVEITKSDIYLEDKEGNRYSIESYVSYYGEELFSNATIQPDDEINLRIVFDVPDPNKEFTLSIKGKPVDVSP